MVFFFSVLGYIPKPYTLQIWRRINQAIPFRTLNLLNRNPGEPLFKQPKAQSLLIKTLVFVDSKPSIGDWNELPDPESLQPKSPWLKRSTSASTTFNLHICLFNPQPWKTHLIRFIFLICSLHTSTMFVELALAYPHFLRPNLVFFPSKYYKTPHVLASYHFRPKKPCVFSKRDCSVWWFGTFFPYIGNVIIPTDFHSIIFQRGRVQTTNQYYIVWLLTND